MASIIAQVFEGAKHISKREALIAMESTRDENGRYICPKEDCDRNYTSKYIMLRHIKTHNGLRPFQCPHCPKSFQLAQYLKDHLYIHTGERPY